MDNGTGQVSECSNLFIAGLLQSFDFISPEVR